MSCFSFVTTAKSSRSEEDARTRAQQSTDAAVGALSNQLKQVLEKQAGLEQQVQQLATTAEASAAAVAVVQQLQAADASREEPRESQDDLWMTIDERHRALEDRVKVLEQHSEAQRQKLSGEEAKRCLEALEAQRSALRSMESRLDSTAKQVVSSRDALTEMRRSLQAETRTVASDLSAAKEQLKADVHAVESKVDLALQNMAHCQEGLLSCKDIVGTLEKTFAVQERDLRTTCEEARRQAEDCQHDLQAQVAALRESLDGQVKQMRRQSRAWQARVFSSSDEDGVCDEDAVYSSNWVTSSSHRKSIGAPKRGAASSAAAARDQGMAAPLQDEEDTSFLERWNGQ
mmetsp:Transcript_48563/g.115428  ORF Transcript_48563/g.115428 Transcript_48563/m.115428 type:complete len:345 (-) Transcript_48563:126-1160(-)